MVEPPERAQRRGDGGVVQGPRSELRLRLRHPHLADALDQQAREQYGQDDYLRDKYRVEQVDLYHDPDLSRVGALLFI
jgi:hypothetical protein